MDKEQAGAITSLMGSRSQSKLKGDGRQKPQDSGKGEEPGPIY